MVVKVDPADLSVEGATNQLLQDSTKRQTLQKLGAAMLLLEDVFVCNSSHSLSDSSSSSSSSIQISSTATDASPVCLPLPVNLNTHKDSLETFLACCQMSPFGKGDKTVIDETVRKAFHIPRDQIISTGIPDKTLNEIIEQVRCNLAPDAKKIHAELHKINVYGPGGFFDSHWDTPRDELSFGTLVVCLPVAFKGGELCVWSNCHQKGLKEQKNQYHRFAWGNSLFESSVSSSSMSRFGGWNYRKNLPNANNTAVDIHTTTPSNKLQWAAFYGNCHHKITPVTDGYRVTVSFVLRHDPDSPGLLLMDPPHLAGTEKVSADASGEADDATDGQPPVKRQKEDYHSYDKAALKQMCRDRELLVGGNRATLIARLTDNPDSPSSPVPMFTNAEAKTKGTLLFRLLQEAVNNPNFLPDGGLVGFPCLHLYERDSEMPPIKDPTGEKPIRMASDLHLKGSDVLLYVASSMLNLEPQVIRMLTENLCDDRFVVPKLPTLKEAQKMTKSVSICRGMRARGLSYEEIPEADEGHVTSGDSASFGVLWVFDLPKPDVMQRRRACSKPVPMMRPVLDCFLSGTDYFGNEASEATIYAHAAIVIKFPSWEDRKERAPAKDDEESLLNPEIFSGAKKGLSAIEELQQMEA
eukprot:Nk52_evm1s454 gene=Nk52_evmTU1s454